MSFAHEPTNCPGVSERSKNNNIYNTKLNPNKSPDYDLITGKILKKLPKKRLSTLQRHLMESSARHTYRANGKNTWDALCP